MSLARRVRAVEAQTRMNRPEMKCFTSAYDQDITNASSGVMRPCYIAQGDGVDERTGNKIRVFRIDVRGTIHSNIEPFLIQCKTDNIPSYSTDYANGYIVEDKNTTEFTEWLKFINMSVTGADTPCRFSKRFKGGLVVKYNGTTGADYCDNHLVIWLVNPTGTTQSVNLNCRIWYTDA